MFLFNISPQCSSKGDVIIQKPTTEEYRLSICLFITDQSKHVTKVKDILSIKREK